jgi:hypothetical protein
VEGAGSRDRAHVGTLVRGNSLCAEIKGFRDGTSVALDGPRFWTLKRDAPVRLTPFVDEKKWRPDVVPEVSRRRNKQINNLDRSTGPLTG